MERFFGAILKHKKIVLAVFIVAVVICVCLIPRVRVNYDFSDYLPEDTPSTVAIHAMSDAFESKVPNGRLYVSGLDVTEASSLVDELLTLDAMQGVMWLGDVVDLQQPLAMANPDLVSAWFDAAENGYLFQLTLDTSDSSGAAIAITQIREAATTYTDGTIALAGEAVNTATAMGSTTVEIQLIMLMAVAIILGLLLLTSESWFEPVLFLAVIGVAIVLNLGTNIFRGEISFITQMCGAILQLAVSMDYGIVMLHTYREFRAEGYKNEEAMAKACAKAFAVIASSAATTFFGFLSLMVMAFLIGADMGIVLAKGVLFSFLSVMFLLPTLILLCGKPLGRMMHRKLLPSFDRFGRVCTRLSIPFSIIVVLLAVPAFLGQGRLSYTYGASGFVEPGSQLYEETNIINDRFGANEQWVILVPQGQWANEMALIDDLENEPLISSVTSYTTAASVAIPTDVVAPDTISQLISGGNSRLIVSTKIASEGEAGFELIKTVRALCSNYYGDTYHLVGASATTYDMHATVSSDSLRVTLASIISIGLVLLLMFRSLSIPLILLLSIEVSIWINLAIPYFLGENIQYIGYLVISSIQLGATVDYTIILARGYLDQRKTLRPFKAMPPAIANSAITILTSSVILTTAGILIGVISSNGVISELGTLIGRGAAISAVNTFLFLPAMLIAGDWIIRHTTLGLKFTTMKENKHG